MISVIICSRSTNQTLVNNIEATIGVPYELILIDNSNNEYSICEAYNLGVKKSKYSLLCFMHDDIVYHTNNWGTAVINHFTSVQIGAIGIAGTPYYSYMPGAWWGSGIFYENILQSSQEDPKPVLKSNSNGLLTRQVVAFDGVWFCIKKSLFELIKFDEVSFKGFHFYDTDICMQLHNLGVKMYCVNDVLVHHSSIGSMNNTWIENALIFQEKWRQKLPALCTNISFGQLCRFEYKILNEFIWICASNGWENRRIYKLALKYLLSFKKGYLFYKTPGYFIKFAFKMIFKKGMPFYFI
ncbi:glycosyltransferase [Mucilaginibacter sp. OK098]|uniref:glycosyltransferase n=1 Tax=Mucilaginibacter sp. OK098 TaxID=1855297 RepID=UPI000916BE99|nr:glycosyltransferase [Mucilaginibacter sp. OK098]SHN24179.1 Glycosyltransferase, GT2 family [Mucilaginibacter sp. OK098]